MPFSGGNTEAIPREISIVTDPVQKYSVLQMDDRYDVTQYVRDHLSGRFHPWSGEWTHKRRPHDLFSNQPADGPCPCKSKLRYAECCLPTEGVRMPHFQMMAIGPAQESREDWVFRYVEEKLDGADGGREVRARLLKGV